MIICEIGKSYITTELPESEEVLLEKAKKLVDAAVDAGADIVKFQMHDEDEIHPSAKMESPHFSQDRYEWVKRNIMSDWWWWKLRLYCDKKGIEFLATPMSRAAAERMDDRLGVEHWKVGSADILDFVMLDYIRDSGKHVILSSGMSTLEELKKAYKFLDRGQRITIMHCVSMYPCPLSFLNLATIPFLQKEFKNAEVGFSDHSLGIEGAIMANRLGATIIEKHLTLDRGSWGPDHKCSLLPHEFKEMVESLKDERYEINPKVKTEMWGAYGKLLGIGEKPYRLSFRKGLYAADPIKKGRYIGRTDVVAMRPCLDGAIPSEKYEEVLMTPAKKDLDRYEAIT